MPVAPHLPTVVITVRALEVYRIAHLRCPRLGIQPFVRALNDIHGVAPRPYLSTHFSIAFDVYLAVRAIVDGRVQAALGRDTPDWRLKNACPACLYKLEGEPELEIPLLATIDGNNSLKRFSLLGVQVPFMPVPADASYTAAAAATRRLETLRRHALELHTKARRSPGLGDTIGGSDALDERRSGLRQRPWHIAKALQARSKAVKAALITYNEAAEAMSPAKPTLDWEQVVEFAFLSDFDLLREAREDIREEKWALPAGRVAMDAHYKLLRSDEEIGRLDVEIPRFVTYMADEEAFLVREEVRLRDDGKEGIAYQVRLLRMERARFTTLHMYRLVNLSKEPGIQCLDPPRRQRVEGTPLACGQRRPR
ncbi:hypothetical protein B0H11DRAFT_1763763 [Mycena galericulata]|nr:hypothetical protein B0H11DRAFT_1763763 [Mycena galericulata]